MEKTESPLNEALMMVCERVKFAIWMSKIGINITCAECERLGVV